MRTAQNTCCKYRERLAREKKKNKNKENRRNRTNCCGKKAVDTEAKPKIPKCSKLKIKSKIIKKPKRAAACTGCTAALIMSLIKPSIFEREKYINNNHIFCVLEEEDIIQLVNLKAMREKYKELNPCDDKLEKNKKEREKSEAEKKQNKVVNEITECGSRKKKAIKGKKPKQLKLDREKCDISNPMKRKVFTLPDGTECDSICSFDSVVDLTGLELTKKEIKKVKEDRKYINTQGNPQPSKSNKTIQGEEKQENKEENQNENNNEEPQVAVINEAQAEK